MSKKIWNFGRKTLLIMILSMMFCANARAEGEDTGREDGTAAELPGEAVLSLDGLSDGLAGYPPSEKNQTAAEPEAAEPEAAEPEAAEPDTEQGTIIPGSSETQPETAEEPSSAQDTAAMARSTAGYNVKISGYNASQGIFCAAVSGITASDRIREVLIPVWSKADGQDDIIWYTAHKSNGGDYYIDVDIRNHHYSTGTYYIHVYITDATGRQFFACSAEQEIDMAPGTLTVTKNNENEYTLELTGVNVPGGIRQIQFPVWSNVNGQDDIVWYSAARVSSQVYRCRISVANHRGLGQFIVHAYAQMPDNSNIFLGAAGFTTAAPSVGQVQASAADRTRGRFTVRISGVKNGGLIRQLQVPVWSKGDQSDIVWYTASRDSKGDYIVNVDISRHGFNCGTYHVHTYLTDVSGAQQFAGAAACEMILRYQSLSAGDISGTESTYRITLNGLEVPAGERNVQFAVWGAANGQNDLRWYNARQSGGKYICDIRTADHGESGKYIVHAYCNTRGNTIQFIGASGFEVTKKALAAQVQVSDINQTAGTFKVTVKGAASSSGIKKVQIPVWCADDQSDIVWYNAARVSEGIYTANVRVSQHGNHFGTYKIHVYITAGNGVQTFAGSASANISPRNYVYSRSLNGSQQEIGIIGISARRVQFPTWSKTGGQDDIVWYEGRSKGNGEWSVIVNSANHRHSGEYITHIYTDGAFAGSASYQLKKNGIEIADVIRNAGKPAGKTLYVWGGGWNEADTAAGETARTIGVYPEWERYFSSNRQGYSYLPGKRAWERGERQWRFYGLDCSGYLGWVVYNSVQSGRNGAGYVVDASRFASSLAGYGYGSVSSCTPNSVFKPGDIISISGHCYLSLGQCSDGSVLILHSTPNGGVQVSGTVTGGGSSEASRLASSFMQQNYPQWWASFGGEGRQSVDASKYLNGTKFSWTVNSTVGDSERIQGKRANEVLGYLK